MKFRFSRLFIIILAGLLLGCGNTGDLYLPEDTAETFSNDTKIQET
ncbi:LPS translocon maturation chaperone LptM [Porticoccaceae bacterium nBUS_17]|nr:lipoprotein [Porticoccaceae bacterium]